MFDVGIVTSGPGKGLGGPLSPRRPTGAGSLAPHLPPPPHPPAPRGESTPTLPRAPVEGDIREVCEDVEAGLPVVEEL